MHRNLLRAALYASGPVAGVTLCAAMPQSWPEMPKGSGVVHCLADGTVESVRAAINYQAEGVQEVWTRRDASGSDDLLHGAQWVPTEVEVRNGRCHPLSLEINGFQLTHDPKEKHADYYNEAEVVGRYYAECEALVRGAIDAPPSACVVAFDHNVRCAEGRAAGRRVKGGNAVQVVLLQPPRPVRRSRHSSRTHRTQRSELI